MFLLIITKPYLGVGIFHSPADRPRLPVRSVGLYAAVNFLNFV